MIAMENCRSQVKLRSRHEVPAEISRPTTGNDKRKKLG